MAGQKKRAEAAFAKLAGEYKKRKKAAEALVVEWRWAKARLFDIRPLHAESRGWSQGRPLRQAPKDPKDHFECGYDDEGRVVVERQHGVHGEYETFYDWTADPVEIARYDYGKEKEPINLTHAYLKDGRTVATYMSAIYGFGYERFHWVGALVHEIEVYHADRNNGKLKPLKKWHTVKVSYNDKGELQRVELIDAAYAPDTEPESELMFERRGAKIYRKRR